MLELKLDNNVYECEGNWNELSRRKLLALMEVLATPATEGTRMLGICSQMLQLKGNRLKKFIKQTPPIWIHHLCTDEQCLGWIRDQGELLTEYTLRSFVHRGIPYQGPPKRMLRVPLVEMIATRMAFKRYCDNKKAEALDELVAILYRPINPFWWFKIWNKRWTGDKRLPLNDWTLKRRVKRFAKLAPAIKLAILKQYTGALQQFEDQYPMVFKKTGEGGGGEDKRGWINLMFAMSGGIFGTLEQTEGTDSTEVFMKLEFDIKESLRIKDQMNKKR
jgi:hypothetical protein